MGKYANYPHSHHALDAGQSGGYGGDTKEHRGAGRQLLGIGRDLYPNWRHDGAKSSPALARLLPGRARSPQEGGGWG